MHCNFLMNIEIRKKSYEVIMWYKTYLENNGRQKLTNPNTLIQKKRKNNNKTGQKCEINRSVYQPVMNKEKSVKSA